MALQSHASEMEQLGRFRFSRHVWRSLDIRGGVVQPQDILKYQPLKNHKPGFAVMVMEMASYFLTNGGSKLISCDTRILA